MIIRPATIEDYDAILKIWNEIIRTTTIIFASTKMTPTSLATLIEERRQNGYEFFVADKEGTILGFASYTQFWSGNGYTHTMQHTIMLDEKARRQGVGRRLMVDIEAHAKNGSAHTLIAGISSGNEASELFHENLGFVHVARVPEVGRKFNAWHDLILMQKFL